MSLRLQRLASAAAICRTGLTHRAAAYAPSLTVVPGSGDRFSANTAAILSAAQGHEGSGLALTLLSLAAITSVVGIAGFASWLGERSSLRNAPVPFDAAALQSRHWGLNYPLVMESVLRVALRNLVYAGKPAEGGYLLLTRAPITLKTLEPAELERVKRAINAALEVGFVQGFELEKGHDPNQVSVRAYVDPSCIDERLVEAFSALESAEAVLF